MDGLTKHLEVDGVRVYAALSGGILACMVRATDEDTFNAQALAAMGLQSIPMDL